LPERVAPLSCANHPGRPALALCVSCRKRICAACATSWEGIQYCASCLAERRAAVRPGRALWGWVGMTLAAAGLLVAVTLLRAAVAGLLAGVP
jgi:B-box zinc finger protein